MTRFVICLRFALLLLGLSYYDDSLAQPGMAIRMQFGTNNVTQGCYVKCDLALNYRFSGNQLEAGIQINLKNPGHPPVSGKSIRLSRAFPTSTGNFVAEAFFIESSGSTVSAQRNLGVLARYRVNHLGITLGNSFKTYAIRRKASAELDLDNKAARLQEKFNLIYGVGYSWNKPDFRRNLSLALTNIDYFTINQETNPFLKVTYSQRFNQTNFLETDLIYQPAGIFNIYANHFGTFIRSGLQWNAEK